MSLLICIPNRKIDKLVTLFEQQLGTEQVQVWPNISRPEAVRVVLGWLPPDNLWQQLPNLELVSSFGAGVDGLNLASIPQQVQVTRIVDSQLATDMAEYVLTHVLLHKLRLPFYQANQREQVWKPKRAQRYQHIGLLGLGQLGQTVATKLLANGFKVSGWSQNKKTLANIRSYTGEQGLHTLASNSDCLVCLLPLTAQTKGILNRQLFAAMPAHAVVINVGRGDHLNEQDLLHALTQKNLAGASLDVFSQEPLPKAHPFWQHENIVITPHCAALSDIHIVVKQVCDNMEKLQANQALNYVVDKQKGY